MLHILRPAVWEFPHFFVFFLHSSMHSPTRITAVVVILIRSEWTELTKFTMTQQSKSAGKLHNFSTATDTVLYAECSSKCVVCQSASRPRAAQIYFSRVYSALVCHVNRLGTELGTTELGTEPSIPTTRKDHSAAAIQRHTHPYTDLYTTDTKLLILLKTLRAGGSS